MIKKIIATTLATLLISNLFSQPAKADSLSILGGVVTWQDKLYFPDGCSRFAFNYNNSTGVRLLLMGFNITDPYGRLVMEDSEIGIDPNKSGTWNVLGCPSSFKNGNGPYIIKVYVKDYSSTQREVQKEIFFQTIPNSGGSSTSSSLPQPTPTVTVTAQPKPAPTVTITAQPSAAATVYLENPVNDNLQARVYALEAQINLLNSKLKKICGVKPKPKNC